MGRMADGTALGDAISLGGTVNIAAFDAASHSLITCRSGMLGASVQIRDWNGGEAKALPVTGVQVPAWSFTSQASHCLSHWVSQHTPSVAA